MPERYQNGVRVPSGVDAGGPFSRWAVEFLSQVVGWTLVDYSGAFWDNIDA